MCVRDTRAFEKYSPRHRSRAVKPILFTPRCRIEAQRGPAGKAFPMRARNNACVIRSVQRARYIIHIMHRSLARSLVITCGGIISYTGAADVPAAIDPITILGIYLSRPRSIPARNLH